MPVPFTLAGKGKPLVDVLPIRGLSPARASCLIGVDCEPAACAGPCHGRTRVVYYRGCCMLLALQ